jgi:hypothetical protein
MSACIYRNSLLVQKYLLTGTKVLQKYLLLAVPWYALVCTPLCVCHGGDGCVCIYIATAHWYKRTCSLVHKCYKSTCHCNPRFSAPCCRRCRFSQVLHKYLPLRSATCVCLCSRCVRRVLQVSVSHSELFWPLSHCVGQPAAGVACFVVLVAAGADVAGFAVQLAAGVQGLQGLQ